MAAEEIPNDPELLSLTLGMEKYYGYQAFKDRVHRRDLKPGDEIILFHKLPGNGYAESRYSIVDEERVEGEGALVEKTRKILQGNAWFRQKPRTTN